jgi:hypothetical protein
MSDELEHSQRLAARFAIMMTELTTAAEQLMAGGWPEVERESLARDLRDLADVIAPSGTK